MRSDRRFKDCRDTARLVRGVATMGASLVRSGLFVVALIAIAGCGRMNADAVRDKDQQREDVSKKMSGNDIPPDPADGR